MKKNKIRFLLFAVCAIGLMLLSSCSVQTPATTTPTTSPTARLSEEGGEAALDLPVLNVIPTLVEIVPTRTPMPTATPDALAEGILEIVQKTGLSEKTFFWLGFADWINLGISLFYVLVGYLIGTWLIHWLFPRLVSRTKTNLDDLLLRASANELRWLAVVLIFRFSINRLNFIHAGVKAFIADISFFLTLFLVAELLWRLISLAAHQADDQARKLGHQSEAESLITLVTWTLRLIVIIFVVALTLNHFGVNITGFAFILGVIVLAFSLAGRDILTDIISGAMILIDRPFRIGDRLELPSIESWGDVVDIGMRSTRILSVENRMVVVPNSQISKNQIVNYSYPDPSFFVFIDVRVAYDNDPEQVAEIIEDAIRSVEGVQTDRGVLAWLIELNEFHMRYWACWWVANYADRYPVQNRVSRAIVKALKEAGVVMPYWKDRMDLKTDSVHDSLPGETDSGDQI